jgi:hypothetical protein
MDWLGPERAHAFAKHLEQVFQPHPSENNPEEEEEEEDLIQLLETPYQLEPPIKCLKRTEVQEIINSLNPKKSPGYDFITGKILKELPIIRIQYLTQLFNAVLLKGYFLAQWKVAQINLIPKPWEPPNELTSSHPVSFLPIISKVVEKLLLKRLFPMVEKKSVNTKSSVWLQTKAFHDRTNTLNCTADK